MILTLIVLAVLVVLALVYRVRAAWSPFTSHGRRRAFYWAGGWWRGEQAQNRDEY